MKGDPSRAWSPRRPLVVGILALVILVGGVGGWSVFSQLSGAIVASGMIEVEGNRQAVQHPEGGVVGAILVDDGDVVQAGDVVLRFDDTLLRSELAIVEGQLYEIMARKARLRAERDGGDAVQFVPELLAVAETDAEIAEQVAGQRQLFHARAESNAKEVSQLRERIIQIERQIDGTQAQIDAIDRQLELIGRELTDQQTLLDKGLTQASRVLSLERESARLSGVRGELVAREAQLEAQQSETEIEILRLGSTLREDAIRELRDLQYREIELRERRLSTKETLDRLEVRAPVSGLVYSRQVNAVRQVIRPADVLMYIVPQEQPLVISAQIPTVHIDEIRVGQPATLLFSSFNRRTPSLNGQVTKVSADAFTDENTGRTYYTAELLLSDGEVDRLQGLELLPGMPAEAFIKTGERTPLNYLLKPLTDYFNRAFRET